MKILSEIFCLQYTLEIVNLWAKFSVLFAKISTLGKQLEYHSYLCYQKLRRCSLSIASSSRIVNDNDCLSNYQKKKPIN